MVVVRRVRRGCGGVCWAWRPTRSDCEKVTLLIWFANMGLFTGYTEYFIFCQITPLFTSGRADLADGDDDGLEAESQDSGSECRRC